MDPVNDAITAVTQTADTNSATNRRDASSAAEAILAQDEFLQIMIAELTNQDPLEPLDNQQFLSQLVQTQTLQATTQLTESIESLLLGQQISSAGSLVGQDVTAVADDGTAVTGTVERVLVDDGDVRLTVAGRIVALDSVTEIGGSSPVANGQDETDE